MEIEICNSDSPSFGICVQESSLNFKIMICTNLKISKVIQNGLSGAGKDLKIEYMLYCTQCI